MNESGEVPVVQGLRDVGKGFVREFSIGQVARGFVQNLALINITITDSFLGLLPPAAPASE